MNIDEAFDIEYKKVLEHRKKCWKWGKSFCLECFGGGLTNFMNKTKGRCK